MSKINANTIENVAGTKSVSVDVLADGGIGVNQTWQDLTASRASGVTYTNSTGKPIYLRIGSSQAGNIIIDGITTGSTSSSASSTTSALIPNGSTYLRNGIFSNWSELR